MDFMKDWLLVYAVDLVVIYNGTFYVVENVEEY